VAAGSARQLWEEGAAAARLMEFAVDAGVADVRWRRVRNSVFSKLARDGGVLRALYCVPVFVKFRVRAGALLDAKLYLQAGAVSLTRGDARSPGGRTPEA
jgi:hypothetical protein